jgi:hypothetical protein
MSCMGVAAENAVMSSSSVRPLRACRKQKINYDDSILSSNSQAGNCTEKAPLDHAI